MTTPSPAQPVSPREVKHRYPLTVRVVRLRFSIDQGEITRAEMDMPARLGVGAILVPVSDGIGAAPERQFSLLVGEAHIPTGGLSECYVDVTHSTRIHDAREAWIHSLAATKADKDACQEAHRAHISPTAADIKTRTAREAGALREQYNAGVAALELALRRRIFNAVREAVQRTSRKHRQDAAANLLVVAGEWRRADQGGPRSRHVAEAELRRAVDAFHTWTADFMCIDDMTIIDHLHRGDKTTCEHLILLHVLRQWEIDQADAAVIKGRRGTPAMAAGDYLKLGAS